jgi:hypothetical protein
LTVKGELVADLAADYQNPKGQQNVPAVFPDTSRTGTWSLFNCRNDALLPAAKDSDRTQLNSAFKVMGCPPGYAYGLEGGAHLGFFADYLPAQDMEEDWRRNFSRDLFDRIIPADERRQFLITHPIADVDHYNLIRWTPSPQLAGKSIGISGKLFSNPGGNGVSLKLVNWKDERTPEALDVLYLEHGRKGTSAIESEFVVHINPGDLGQLVDIAIGNNGSYICDATALRLRVHAGDERYETPGVNVTQKVQSVFQGKFRTDLGKYTDLFGDPAPGQEKTLRLRVQDMSGKVKYIELPDDAAIELP